MRQTGRLAAYRHRMRGWHAFRPSSLNQQQHQPVQDQAQDRQTCLLMATRNQAGSSIWGSYTTKRLNRPFFFFSIFKEIFHFEGAQLHLHDLQNIPVRRHCLHFTGAATEAQKWVHNFARGGRGCKSPRWVLWNSRPPAQTKRHPSLLQRKTEWRTCCQ